MADLSALGFDVARPVDVARGIGGLILSREQKAALLRRYLQETGIPLSEQVLSAADSYREAL